MWWLCRFPVGLAVAPIRKLPGPRPKRRNGPRGPLSGKLVTTGYSGSFPGSDICEYVCLCVYNLFLQGCHLCVLNILPICTNTCTHKIRSPGRNRWKAKRRELLFYRSTRRVGGAAVTHFVWPCGFAFIGLSRIMKATENSHTYLMMVARFLC